MKNIIKRKKQRFAKNIGIKRKKRNLKRKIKLALRSSMYSPKFDTRRVRKIGERRMLELEVPKNFSFIDNTDEVNNFFTKCSSSLGQGIPVFFDMKNIDNLSFDAIVLLLAKMRDRNFTKGKAVGGNLPRNEKLKKLFEESGFFNQGTIDSEKLSSKHPLDIDANIGKMMQNVNYTQKVDTDVAERVYNDIIKNSLNGIDNDLIYPIFIECMANTKNHASLFDSSAEYTWWFSYYMEPETKITKVVFLDLGAGILKTMNKNWGEVFKIDGCKSNIDKIKSVFEGKLVNPSRTGERKRGKGLISMKQFVYNPFVKNFKIISNGVYCDLSNNKYKKLATELNGTFIYMEFHPI